ncbi:hypothetical protein [Agrobacterium tumefaciens]|uniref:hypothetical protein n=1 Tax=Agrobacterium tumefaciens TaxID=358 RepID=UPI001571D50B|nr:hypothetical protein [Agrobacterium tumefaciens]NTA45366.1 nucleotide-binding protein [Agrobacterium tumefaciens]UXU08329.1 nucleotide-binding protein [Agrobacterium tumefaciens]WIE36024.1 hypothetical protein G6L82_023185 [Agrobacterium tumefaciens]
MDTFALGAPISTALTSMIEEADIFVAVLPQESSSRGRIRDNLIFELGLAIGMRKQMLIFAPEGSRLPSDVGDLLTVRIGPKNREAIDFAVSQLLSAPEKERSARPQISLSGRVLGEEIDNLIAQYSDIANRDDGQALERLVAQAINASGVEVISHAGPDMGFDFVIWSDALQSSVGNPLMVEVRSRISSKAYLKRAEQRLATIARNNASEWSLLIYGEGPKAPPDIPSIGGVISLSVLELLENLRTATFVEVVRRLRNRHAHGGLDGHN